MFGKSQSRCCLGEVHGFTECTERNLVDLRISAQIQKLIVKIAAEYSKNIPKLKVLGM